MDWVCSTRGSEVAYTYLYTPSKKGKLVHVHTMQTYRGVEV